MRQNKKYYFLIQKNYNERRGKQNKTKWKSMKARALAVWRSMHSYTRIDLLNAIIVSISDVNLSRSLH